MHRSLAKVIISNVPQRYVMTLLGFLLTIIGSTMKYAIGIAITEMVVPPKEEDFLVRDDPDVCPFVFPIPAQTNDTQQEDIDRFEWSETTQGVIFGSLFWTYMTLQIPSGAVIERVGFRYIMGGGMLLSSLCYLLTPLAVFNLGSVGFVIVRVLSGAGLATLYPGLNVMLAKWAPPSEKSQLGGIIYAGENLGFIFSMAISGLILGNSHGDWPKLFYVYGGLGMSWVVLWFCLGYDDPSSHPFITPAEREFLGRCLADNGTKAKLPPTPWSQMVRSLPLWGTVLAQIGHDWGLVTIVSDLPKYMKSVLHHEIKDNGLLTAIPYAAMTVVAVVSGWLSDWILSKGYLSITNVRKLFTVISALGPSLGLVAAMNSGCSSNAVVAFFTLGMALMGFYYPSLSVNTLDLSPNYSGTLMGLIALGGLAGIVSPYLAGVIAPQGTMAQWHNMFWIAAYVMVASSAFYVVVGSGEVQPWNNPESDPNRALNKDRIKKYSEKDGHHERSQEVRFEDCQV